MPNFNQLVAITVVATISAVCATLFINLIGYGDHRAAIAAVAGSVSASTAVFAINLLQSKGREEEEQSAG